MAKGVKSAVPATPAKSSGTRNETSVRSGSSFSTPTTDRMESIDERSVSYDTAIDSSDAKENDEDDDWDVRTAISETSEAAVVSANRSGGSRSITRDLSETFNDMPGPEPAYDADDGATEGFKASVAVGGTTSKPVGTRPPLNGDNPAANKVLGRCLELMKTKREWMQLFSPKQVRQAIWMDLGGALATPMNLTSTRQVAQNTVDLMRAMGWRKKLRDAFGVAGRGSTKLRPAPEAVNPSKVPLPVTPRKATTDDGVFAVTGEASPYMQDSHMVTPRSTDRSERLARETEVSYATPGTRGATDRRSSRHYDLRDDSSDSDDDLGPDCYEGDLPSEWAPQVRELSATDNQSSTSKLEIVTHLPLASIKPFFGTRDKSEHSMQWLPTFIYEMKGTHASPVCPPTQDETLVEVAERGVHQVLLFEVSQSAKARYHSAKQEDKEHVCDYLNRLNGYARNAGVQFENGGRDAKDHVEHFLVTCDDRNLEDRLCHVRVKSIHDLENMINDILRHRDRSRPANHRSTAPAVKMTVAVATQGRTMIIEVVIAVSDVTATRTAANDVTVTMTAAPIVVMTTAGVTDVTGHRTGSVGARNEAPYAPRRDAEANEDYFEDERQYSGDQRSDEDSDADYDSDGSTGHVAAANDAERRAAAEGN
ncbi:hypothetical protein PHYSODRAFT_322898 [Phytophthora sojae]|uniref:Uncharacterized protein n=1 Tax=Phytophthora sojae (strain P6497) TaxID=1094619 RepID=G4YHQ6_PHYSP|nr:hypothetical protein PHYSODRAFT_322898 [Phytophthora sojae]EGZ29374.1 hypothetical protein PHYSODRAFT_322898 [Phytophthora sojae]|eukprot:XP_009516649.1 hypothetical protein PHYSODRAFT_322898 [Phytophthora sojae]